MALASIELNGFLSFASPLEVSALLVQSLVKKLALGVVDRLYQFLFGFVLNVGLKFKMLGSRVLTFVLLTLLDRTWLNVVILHSRGK